jgi:hypothetical protein
VSALDCAGRNGALPHGRWFVGDLTAFEESRRTIYEGSDFRNKRVAVCDTPEQAQLIVGALNAMPELLASASALMSELEDMVGSYEFGTNKRIASLRAAIARATVQP